MHEINAVLRTKSTQFCPERDVNQETIQPFRYIVNIILQTVVAWISGRKSVNQSTAASCICIIVYAAFRTPCTLFSQSNLCFSSSLCSDHRFSEEKRKAVYCLKHVAFRRPCTLFSNQTIVLLSTLYQALYMVYDLFLIQAYIDKLVSKDLWITTKHVIRWDKFLSILL